MAAKFKNWILNCTQKRLVTTTVLLKHWVFKHLQTGCIHFHCNPDFIFKEKQQIKINNIMAINIMPVDWA